MKPEHPHEKFIVAEIRVLEAEIKIAMSMALSARTEEREQYWFTKAAMKEKRKIYAAMLLAKHRGEVR